MKEKLKIISSHRSSCSSHCSMSDFVGNFCENSASTLYTYARCGEQSTAVIAQLGERKTEDLKVSGSIPDCGSFLFLRPEMLHGRCSY